MSANSASNSPSKLNGTITEEDSTEKSEQKHSNTNNVLINDSTAPNSLLFNKEE